MTTIEKSTPVPTEPTTTDRIQEIIINYFGHWSDETMARVVAELAVLIPAAPAPANWAEILREAANWETDHAIVLTTFLDAIKPHWPTAATEPEKRYRIYYQDIVYAVCNRLDAATGRKPGVGVVCGTADNPTTEVQEALDELLAKRKTALAAEPSGLREELLAYITAHDEGYSCRWMRERGIEWVGQTSDIRGIKSAIRAILAKYAHPTQPDADGERLLKREERIAELEAENADLKERNRIGGQMQERCEELAAEREKLNQALDNTAGVVEIERAKVAELELKLKTADSCSLYWWQNYYSARGQKPPKCSNPEHRVDLEAINKLLAEITELKRCGKLMEAEIIRLNATSPIAELTAMLDPKDGRALRAVKRVYPNVVAVRWMVYGDISNPRYNLEFRGCGLEWSRCLTGFTIPDATKWVNEHQPKPKPKSPTLADKFTVMAAWLKDDTPADVKRTLPELANAIAGKDGDK